MRPAFWVVLAAALAARPALAESSVPLSPPPPPPQENEREDTSHGPAEPHQPSLPVGPTAEAGGRPAMPPGQPPSVSSSSLASRLLGETIGGVLGELSLGWFGASVGSSLDPGQSVLFLPKPGSIIGGMAGIFLGGGLGVFAGAALSGERGNLLAALAGSAVGTFMTYLLMYAVTPTSIPLLVVALLFPTFGAMIGYELFQPPALPAGRPAAERAGGGRLRPVVSISPGGERTVLGLAGLF